MTNLDYVIKNHKNLYIKLSENGKPTTCSEHEKSLFEYSKAKNICENLPKILKKLKFFVEAIPDIPQKTKENKVIEINTYHPSKDITRWINKFDKCCDVIDEALERREELNKELSDIDKAFQNIIHKIEEEDTNAMCTRYNDLTIQTAKDMDLCIGCIEECKSKK